MRHIGILKCALVLSLCGLSGGILPISAKVWAAEELKVEIYAVASSWVRVHDRVGQVLLSKNLQEGDNVTFVSRAGLLLDTGNAAALSLRVNQQPYPSLVGASPSVVRRDIPVDPDSLRAAIKASFVPMPSSTLESAKRGDTSNIGQSQGANPPTQPPADQPLINPSFARRAGVTSTNRRIIAVPGSTGAYNETHDSDVLYNLGSETPRKIKVPASPGGNPPVIPK